MNEYKDKDNNDRLILVETVGISYQNRVKYYDAGCEPFFFNLIAAKDICNATAACFKQLIEEGLNIPKGEWPNFVIGNHDNKRLADRMGQAYVDSMNMLLLTLPGTPTTYYGEELGMAGGDYQNLPPKDPYAITSNTMENSRDSERNPMQWDSTSNAGFSNCTPTEPTGYCTWLKITYNTNYTRINVETEIKDGSSSLNIYRYLAQVRQSPAFQSLNIELQTQRNLLLYKRWSDSEVYLVALNLGATTDSFSLPEPSGHIVVATKASKINQDISLASVALDTGEGLLIQL